MSLTHWAGLPVIRVTAGSACRLGVAAGHRALRLPVLYASTHGLVGRAA